MFYFLAPTAKLLSLTVTRTGQHTCKSGLLKQNRAESMPGIHTYHWAWSWGIFSYNMWVMEKGSNQWTFTLARIIHVTHMPSIQSYFVTLYLICKSSGCKGKNLLLIISLHPPSNGPYIDYNVPNHFSTDLNRETMLSRTCFPNVKSCATCL